MNKRIFLAVVLTVGVIALSQLLFPPIPPAEPDATAPRALDVPGAVAGQPDAVLPPGQDPIVPTIGEVEPLVAADSVDAIPVVRAETTEVATPVSLWGMSNVGAAPVRVRIEEHRSLSNGALDPDAPPVEMVRDGEALISYRVAVPGDTVSFANTPFTVSRSTGSDGAPVLDYRAMRDGIELAIRYAFVPDSYLVRVTVTAAGAPARSFLMVGLPSGIRSAESDTLEDQTHLAYAYKPQSTGASSIGFGKLDPGEQRLQSGPLTWVAAKNKYFIVGLLNPEGAQPFAEFTAVGGARTGQRPTNASGTVLLPISGEPAEFELYAGPQEWRRLVALGRDFKDSNPYGGFMQGIVQPFATIVMAVLLWMRETTMLSYGWVLVIFGVAVRLVMWPLNQKAMRAQMRMTRIQPDIQAVQKKYAKDPQKQQQEIMKVYKEHGMSPFSMFSGCLPLLLPMPIYLALFIVFRNTIEYRGVPFLWLDDISLKDPYYILPLLMGATTFLVSWIGMRGMKEIPQQQKMIMYVIPITMTFVLLNFASGLNLYYTIQNIAALPQQWLIARERVKVTAEAEAARAAKAKKE